MTKNKVMVIIAGGRKYNDYEQLVRVADHMLSKLVDTHDITIVAGGAIGTDTMGANYARLRGFNLEIRIPNWDTYGKSAGYRRNVDMANIATHLLAFWDGESRGTGHMIDIAHSMKIKVHVTYY